MIKTKIFSSNNAVQLEKEINNWLEATSWAKVINISQSSNSDKTVICIWYEEPEVPIF